MRTNTTEITEALSGKWRQAEIAEENERLKGIINYNVEKVKEIQRTIQNAVSMATSSAIAKAEQGK